MPIDVRHLRAASHPSEARSRVDSVSSLPVVTRYLAQPLGHVRVRAECSWGAVVH
jgi:hypothetical protein